ncbi:MAG: histidine kinase [Gammaproteobacteria bacterium]|nr:histidine kinase [Gammaproteobacteria bacterium]
MSEHSLSWPWGTDARLRNRAASQPAGTNNVDLLPNFCGGEMVINVVVLAQFLAVAATVISRPVLTNVFQDLLITSLFVQWVALTSVAVLCLLRRMLNRLPPGRVVIMMYLVLLCVTWGVSEAALWLMWGVGFITSPRPDWYSYFHIQNLTVSAIVNALALRYFLARHELRLKTLSEARARVDILKSRIRPHFLFNSMNIIASLTHAAPARAEAAIEDLADLFRLMLDESKDLVNVQKEVVVARKYLKIEQLRLEDRLRVDWDVETIPTATKTPALILQLILEHVIQHSIESLTEGGTINIGLKTVNHSLQLSVSSPAPDSSEMTQELQSSATLEYIQLKLREHYGDAATIDFGIDQDRQFLVKIAHPISGEIE